METRTRTLSDVSLPGPSLAQAQPTSGALMAPFGHTGGAAVPGGLGEDTEAKGQHTSTGLTTGHLSSSAG